MRKFFTHADPVLPVHMPRALVEAAVAHGADREALLEGVGVSEETLCLPDARVSYAQFETIEANALRLTNNPAFGLHFGHHVHLSHVGVVALAAMSSPTAGAALRIALMYYRSIVPAWELELSVTGNRGLVSGHATISRGGLQSFATEALVVGFHGLASQVLGRGPPGLVVRLNYPKPAHFAEYARFLGCPVLFDQDGLEVEFDASVLEEPLAGSNPAMAARAEQYCVSEAASSVSVEGLAAQMRLILRSCSTGQPNLGNVAHALQTSPRSLRRDLHAMGTSFQELLDETRRARRGVASLHGHEARTGLEAARLRRHPQFSTGVQALDRPHAHGDPARGGQGLGSACAEGLRAPGSAVTAVTSCLMTRVRTSRGAWRHVCGLQLPLPWSASMRASRRSRCSLRARGIVGPSFSKNSP